MKFLDFPDISLFWQISLTSFVNFWGNWYIPCLPYLLPFYYIYYHLPFITFSPFLPRFILLVVKGKFDQISKSLKILWRGLSTKFIFLLISLEAAPFLKNSHILAGIYFIFLKNTLDQTWKTFNTNFGL